MHSKQQLTLIKLGGSIITHKDKPNTLRAEVLKQLVQEIAAAQQSSTEQYIIGHGQGSFAHYPAKKYGTKHGFTHADSRIGMAKTLQSVVACNNHVVSACIDAGLPGACYFMNSALVTAADKKQHWSAEVLEMLLEKEMLPITCGDVIVDAQQGCTIWSTEKILGLFAAHFARSKKYTVSRIIHVTDVPGVLDDKKQLIKQITPDNFAQVKKHLYGVNGADVTGGMLHKIEESLVQAQAGTEVRIISGLEPGVLQQALAGEAVGTAITGS